MEKQKYYSKKDIILLLYWYNCSYVSIDPVNYYDYIDSILYIWYDIIKDVDNV